MVEPKQRGDGMLFALAVTMNSLIVMTIYLSINSLGTFPIANLTRLLEGTAERPYVMRVLIPFLARLLAPIVPVQVVEQLPTWPDPFGRTLYVLANGGYHREAVVVLVLIFLSLVGFGFAERSFIKELAISQHAQNLLPHVGLVLILPFSVTFAYIYDIPQLFLTTLCLLYLKQEKWRSYYIAFALASFNKETSLFLVLVFIIYYRGRLPLERFRVLLTAQMGIYGLARLSLLYAFRDNPGSIIVFTYNGHFEQYIKYLSIFFFTVFLFFLIGYFVWRNWDHKHPFLKATLVIPLTILALFFVAGMPMEFRVFLDGLPSLLVLIMPPGLPASQAVLVESKT